MNYSIKQVSEMSGVSIRALRLYDEMNLVRPRRRENGYRVYSSMDLDVLQQVLLYKACGVELQSIKRILHDPDFDRYLALNDHLNKLYSHRKQLDMTIETLKKTIGTLEGVSVMTDKEKFAGLKQAAIDENEKKYGKEARERWRDEMIDSTNRHTSA